MTARATVGRALLACTALATACQVGDPLVDKQRWEPKGVSNEPTCEMPEDCSEPFELELSVPSPKPLTPGSCATACDLLDDPITEVAGSDAFADAFACEPRASLDAASNSEVACENRRFLVDDATTPARGDRTITGAKWRDSHVLIEAGEPVELTFEASELTGVRIHLSGPVALVFRGGTRLLGLEISGASAEASVAFDEVKPKDLTIGDADAPFAGHVAARHTAIDDASLVVGSVELDSTRIGRAFIAARELVSNDGALADVALDVGAATLAPTALSHVDIQRCESLSIFGSELSSVRVPPCSGAATRLYATTFTDGTLDGTVTADDSRLEHLRLGQNAPSDLVLWETKVFFDAFCDELRSLKVPEHAVQCSVCSEGAFDPLEKACLLPGGAPPAAEDDPLDLGESSNFCEAIALFEPCEPPLPDRSRPIHGADPATDSPN